jgi:transcriptional regulator with XRE-family HTH domain
MDTLAEDEREIRHYLRVLRQAIRAAGLSVTEVERRLGVGAKALRRVFSGQIDLKFRHLVVILRVIGMPHDEFFAIAARRRRRASSVSREFLAIFERVGYRGVSAPPADDDEAVSDDEFDRIVEEAATRLIKRRRERRAGERSALDAGEPAAVDQLGGGEDEAP